MVFPQLFLGGFLPTSEMKAAGPNREAPCPVAWRNRWFSGRPRHWGPVVSNTVDGRHPTNQLRLVVYPFFSRVIYIYHHSTNNKTLFWTRCVWLTIFWRCKTFLVCRPIRIEQMGRLWRHQLHTAFPMCSWLFRKNVHSDCLPEILLTDINQGVQEHFKWIRSCTLAETWQLCYERHVYELETDEHGSFGGYCRICHVGFRRENVCYMSWKSTVYDFYKPQKTTIEFQCCFFLGSNHYKIFQYYQPEV